MTMVSVDRSSNSVGLRALIQALLDCILERVNPLIVSAVNYVALLTQVGRVFVTYGKGPVVVGDEDHGRVVPPFLCGAHFRWANRITNQPFDCAALVII